MYKNLENEKKWLLDEKYNGEKCFAFFTDLEKLKNGEPLAYLIGNQPFLNCKINLEFKPLIPRPETEFWVNDFIKKELKNKQEKREILDIFSGSGCIGISVLKNTKNNFIDFAEIKPNFIKQIQKNLDINSVDKKIYNIFRSNIFKDIPKKKYDYILANPPYIPKNKKIDDSVKKFEDYNSLFAKGNGLYFVKKIILNGKSFLKKDGGVFIEFDETSKNDIEKFLIENKKKIKIKNYVFKKDQFNNWRILILKF